MGVFNLGFNISGLKKLDKKVKKILNFFSFIKLRLYSTFLFRDSNKHETKQKNKFND